MEDRLRLLLLKTKKKSSVVLYWFTLYHSVVNVPPLLSVTQGLGTKKLLFRPSAPNEIEERFFQRNSVNLYLRGSKEKAGVWKMYIQKLSKITSRLYDNKTLHMVTLYHGMHCFRSFQIFATNTVPVSVSCNTINSHRGKANELINLLFLKEELEELTSFACLHMI